MPESTKILVVDNDSIDLQIIVPMLKSFGYNAVTASSGLEALARLSGDIRMILLDVMMPGMDGFEVARRIRAHPEYGDVPIIMVTSLSRNEDRLDAVQAGANDFVSKPLDRVELKVRIASHLKLKEAQDKRRESDIRYRMLVENSPVGILRCNRSGEIGEINAAAANLFRISGREAGSPQNLFENPALSAAGVSESLKDCLESGATIVKEFPVAGQGDKHARLYVVPFRDRGGAVSGLQVVCEDISDQRRAEELSRRRTRLRAFAEMARGAAKHFSEALEKIGEECIRGLAAIDSGAYMEATPSLREIRVAAARASQTLRLLEKFSRGYSKRDTLGWAAFDFSDAVSDGVEASMPSWKTESAAKGININLECDFVGGCFIEGERPDVVDVAAHLIRNAAEAMPAGGNLRVKTSRERDYAVLEVEDEGEGMTQEEMQRIGFPFRTSKESHLGLGLAVSLGIIRRHFGTFAIASKKGRGTIFTARFPLTASQKKETEESTVEILASNPKTLFLDPDESIRRRFATGHQGKGPMYFARSIEEAMQIVNEKNIDAIVCSEVIESSRIVQLSKRVSVFCASKGMVRPPFIILASKEGSDPSDNILQEGYVGRIVDKSMDVGDLMEIVAQQVLLAISGPRISGTLGQLDILDVVQMMQLSGRQLVLELISQEGKRGLLYISKGVMCHAQFGESEGEDAAYCALSLRSGSFTTLPWAEPGRATINIPGDVLLMEAARRRDEVIP